MTNLLLLSNIVMEFIFAAVTLLIALYAYKIYRIIPQKEFELFSLGFLSISLSYIIWTMMNISALIHMSNIRNIFEAMEAVNILTIGAYCHMILFIVGLAIVSFVTLKSEKMGYLALLIPISILPIFIGTNQVTIFYSLSTVFLAYLSIHYFLEFKAKSHSSSAIVASAFALLAVSTLILLFSGADYIRHIVGHIFAFIAYLLLLFNLIRSLKHGKKTK